MPFKDRTQFQIQFLKTRLCKINLVSNSYCKNIKSTDQNFNRCNNLAPNYSLILELQKYVPRVWFSFASSIAWRVAIKPQLSQNARIILSQVRQLFYNSRDLWCVQNMSPNTTKKIYLKFYSGSLLNTISSTVNRPMDLDLKKPNFKRK